MLAGILPVAAIGILADLILAGIQRGALARTRFGGGDMITFDRVVKRYANSVAVDHLSLEIKSGETVILVGPSGCGKTTSLKMINRLVEPTGGDDQHRRSRYAHL